MRHRRLIPLLIVSCVGLGAPAPASAGPPERFSFTQSDTGEVLANCDGFDAILDSTGSFRGTVIFDRDGIDVRYIIRGRITETLTNSVTGTTVRNRGVFQDFFTRVDGTDEFTHTVSGFDFQGKVEGRGPVVFQDVGRKVFVTDPETGEEIVVVRTGHHTLGEGSEAETVFCAALS